MNSKSIRKGSLAQARQLGYPTNPALPLLEALELRPVDEIFSRTLCLDAALSCAFGHPAPATKKWLAAEGLTKCLTPGEAKVLRGDQRAGQSLQVQIECLWGFVWALGHVARLDFDHLCGDHLIQIVPNLKFNETSASFRAASRLRDAEEVAAACDLAYCLHWALRECERRGQPAPGRVPAEVIVERRRALEWVCSDADWDDVALDT